MPAATSIATVTKPMTIALPMSGSSPTSTAEPATTDSSGRRSARRSCTWRGRFASSVAEYSTSASFNSSDGSNCSGPTPSQRRAPLTVTPRCGTCTASTSTIEVASSGPVKRVTSSMPLRASTRMTTSPTAP